MGKKDEEAKGPPCTKDPIKGKVTSKLADITAFMDSVEANMQGPHEHTHDYVVRTQKSKGLIVEQVIVKDVETCDEKTILIKHYKCCPGPCQQVMSCFQEQGSIMKKKKKGKSPGSSSTLVSGEGAD